LRKRVGVPEKVALAAYQERDGKKVLVGGLLDGRRSLKRLQQSARPPTTSWRASAAASGSRSRRVSS
jgi:hypothetical protein